MIDEIVAARVYSGIHFRTADTQGARLGRQVARYGERHYFRPRKPSATWEHGSDGEGDATDAD